MDISYYYQILDIGILYEKGKKSGKMWKYSERKRLRKEVIFWEKVLNFILLEKKGIDCSKSLFETLNKLCQKYKFPNYERILRVKEKLINSSSAFETNKIEEAKIHTFMLRLMVDILYNLEDLRGKEKVYCLLAILHNLPRAMHGKNILNSNNNLISYNDALRYAENYMISNMKEEYSGYF